MIHEYWVTIHLPFALTKRAIAPELLGRKIAIYKPTGRCRKHNSLSLLLQQKSKCSKTITLA
jgi:hypothetical protein